MLAYLGPMLAYLGLMLAILAQLGPYVGHLGPTSWVLGLNMAPEWRILASTWLNWALQNLQKR